MLTVPMSNPHSSPYPPGGGRYEHLAPLRAKSTSPSQRLRGSHYRNASPATHEQPDSSPASSPSSMPHVPKEDIHLMPAPLKSASEVTQPRLSPPLRDGEALLLQPVVYSKPQTRVSNDTQHLVTYSQPSPTRDDTFTLHPAAYSPPQRSRSHLGERINLEQQYHLPRSQSQNTVRHADSMSSSSSAPVSPWPARDVPPPPDPLSIMTPVRNSRKSTFADPHDFGLFAEALSGIGPGLMADAVSHAESHAESPTLTPPCNQPFVSPISPEEASYLVSRPVGDARIGNSYPSPVAAAYALPPAPDFDGPSIFDGFQAGPPTLQVPQDSALSNAMLGMHLEDDRPRDDDDELPDYEQSQREAADQARRKALSRAAELESRWAASAPHRMR